MSAYDEMVLKIAPKGKKPLFLNTGVIVKPVRKWIATLSEEEKEREIVRIGNPPIKVRDIPRALQEDAGFREFWVRKSIAYYNEFLAGKA